MVSITGTPNGFRPKLQSPETGADRGGFPRGGPPHFFIPAAGKSPLDRRYFTAMRTAFDGREYEVPFLPEERRVPGRARSRRDRPARMHQGAGPSPRPFREEPGHPSRREGLREGQAQVGSRPLRGDDARRGRSPCPEQQISTML